jgi:hypothetical protein
MRVDRTLVASGVVALFAVLLPVAAYALLQPSAAITGLTSPTHPAGGWVSSSEPEFTWGVTADGAAVLLGSCEMTGTALGLAASGTTVYLADANSGLRVVDASDPAMPTLRGTCDTPGSARSVAVSGTTAYVADESSGLQIIDVSNATSPTIVGSYDTPGRAAGVAVSGATAYVADGDLGLHVIDVTTPTAPVLLGTCDTPGTALSVAVWGTTAYVADGVSGLQVIDVSNPSSPVIVGSCAMPEGLYSQAYDVAVSGTKAYVTSLSAGLQIVDVSDPSAPVLVGSYRTPGLAAGVAVSGTTAYVGTAESAETGFYIIDVSDPSVPALLGSRNTSSTIGVAVSGAQAYATDYPNGLLVFDASIPVSYSYEMTRDATTVPDAAAEGSQPFTTLAGISDGVWYFHVRPILAGVAQPTSHLRIRIDSTAPALTIAASPSAVTLTASDALSGVADIWYRIDGGAPQLYTGVPFSPGAPGHHTIVAWARDNAANVSADAVDVTVPLPLATVGTPETGTRMRVRRGYVVRGTLAPRHVAGSSAVRVRLWRLERGRWKSYGYKNATVVDDASGSRYSVRITLRKTGRWRLRAYHADAGHAPSWSNGYAYVRVR